MSLKQKKMKTYYSEEWAIGFRNQEFNLVMNHF